MIELEFLSTDLAQSTNGWSPERRSSLAHALGTRGAELGIEDITLDTGKIEYRGDVDALAVDAEVLRITDRRALVVCPYDRVASLRDAVAGSAELAVDQTGALAGLRITRPDAETLVRRLTELRLDTLPTVGSVAHVQAYVTRDGADTFRLFFAQEYGDYVGEVVLDAAEGLEAKAG